MNGESSENLSQNTAIFILAGGKSSRMMFDKGLVFYKGKQMVEWMIEKTSNFDLPVSIVANNEEYLKFGIPVYRDAIPTMGPMGGLFTAMQNCDKDFVLLLPCDMPNLSKESMLKMLPYLNEKNEIRVSSILGRMNPLLACYKRSLIELVHQSLMMNHLKMQDFVTSRLHEVVCLSPNIENEFKNFNSPQDLEDA